ncbi:MAG: dihydropteroate synthase [Lawsonibacter sp.]|nr:dihydropteroate synthase [Lawsonibacter sp.]
MDFDFFQDGILILDGAMGTELQKRGLPPGGQPELLNLTAPGLVQDVHRAYLQAGSRVVYANTFGANALKLARSGHTVDEAAGAAVALAREACAPFGAKTALDIGPLGELLEPMGTLRFERAYDLFRELALAGARAGADLAVIETMTDLYETKAALLAVKENTSLPVFVTMSFEESGRTFTGCTPASMARTLEGLGADAVGVNCSLGPDLLLPVLREICENTRLPVIAKPNAGLPDPVTGRYTMGPEEFAAAMLPCLEAGVTIFGGCCGTAPEYIAALARALEGKMPAPRVYLSRSFVCTPVTPVPLTGVRVIGERINPTGKKRIQQALLEDDLDYLLELAVEQEDAGADILDVNVGYPGVDEATMLPRVVKKLQSAVSLPLQLDSSNPAALEAGLRVYNGKAAVNSVSGEEQSLARVLPIVKKYGACVVGLTLDQEGIPQTAQKRADIARRIRDAALERGIPGEDVWIDCLTLTVSAQQDQAEETLKAVRTVREELGLQTVLGVSNISFGLPNRPLITQTFLVRALEAGLTLPIINPNQTEMMDAVRAFRVLSGEDRECRAYVERFAAAPAAPKNAAAPGELTLEDAIVRGLRADAGRLARQALEAEEELSLVENRLIPALDRVGAGYEEGTVFLPQLLSAAQAAQAVFEQVRASIARKGGAPVRKGKLIVATVRGDIHDIGKNIVKTVLENYGYEVDDLGRDVPPETVARAAREGEVRLVGLSALMTTTLPAMEETIRLLKGLPRPPAVFVGGAVVTPEYAARMGADWYARDARQSVEIARKVLG